MPVSGGIVVYNETGHFRPRSGLLTLDTFLHTVVSTLEFWLVIKFAKFPFAEMILFKGRNASTIIFGASVRMSKVKSHRVIISICSCIAQVLAETRHLQFEIVRTVLFGALFFYLLQRHDTVERPFFMITQLAIVDTTKIRIGYYRFCVQACATSKKTQHGDMFFQLNTPKIMFMNEVNLLSAIKNLPWRL